MAGLAVSSQNVRASIIIDSFSTSHSATITIPDPSSLPLIASPTGVLPGGTTIGGARMLAAYVTDGQEDDQYRLRVTNASGYASVETSALVTGKGLITYNGTITPNIGVTGGEFNAPVNYNIAPTDITQGGTNSGVVLSGYADNNGIPIIFTFWVNAGTYATGTLNVPGSVSGILTAHFLAFSSFSATGDTLANILSGVRAITVEFDGTDASVTPGTDVVLDYIIADRDTTVPEPGTYATMGGALLGFGFLHRRVFR
jgi:hypothetical protein